MWAPRQERAWRKPSVHPAQRCRRPKGRLAGLWRGDCPFRCPRPRGINDPMWRATNPDPVSRDVSRPPRPFAGGRRARARRLGAGDPTDQGTWPRAPSRGGRYACWRGPRDGDARGRALRRDRRGDAAGRLPPPASHESAWRAADTGARAPTGAGPRRAHSIHKIREGVDERVIAARELENSSIGDYVLSGGEGTNYSALMDACVRLLPGVMGEEASGAEESFEGGVLEYPQYTRPRSSRSARSRKCFCQAITPGSRAGGARSPCA